MTPQSMIAGLASDGAPAGPTPATAPPNLAARAWHLISARISATSKTRPRATALREPRCRLIDADERAPAPVLSPSESRQRNDVLKLDDPMGVAHAAVGAPRIVGEAVRAEPFEVAACAESAAPSWILRRPSAAGDRAGSVRTSVDGAVRDGCAPRWLDESVVQLLNHAAPALAVDGEGSVAGGAHEAGRGCAEMLRSENARTCEHRATTSLKATRQASGGIDRSSSSGRRTSVEAESASAVARALVVRRDGGRHRDEGGGCDGWRGQERELVE